MKQALRAKKTLGQNFLVDEKVTQQIVRSVRPAAGQTIVEIGPGTGAITRHLTDSGARVIAIELDRRLAPHLRDQFKHAANFTVLEADALEIDYRTFRPAHARLRLVANLPYYISTAILQHLIAFRDSFSDLTLMFQREVVQRIMARPGSSDRGFLTVMIEAFFESEKLFDVSPEAFDPPPKVHSSVIRLIPKPSALSDEPNFRRIVSLAFAHKRKTIANNLKPHFPNLEESLRECGIDGKQRAETLTHDDWVCLQKPLQLEN